nr:hypothetical protein [Nanoarchaeum sp.]
MNTNKILVGLSTISALAMLSYGPFTEDKKRNVVEPESKLERTISEFISNETIESQVKSFEVLVENPLYNVREGESLESVASYYGVRTESIRDINPGVDDLYAGQLIRVPNLQPIEVRFPKLLKYRKDIECAAEIYGLEPRLIYSVLQHESNGNPNAVSPKGARGLGQIMPATARDYGVKNPMDLFNPKINIYTTSEILAYLTEKFGDTEHVLAAYNGGEGRVEKVLARATHTDWTTLLPSETRNYIPAVLAYYN